MSATQDIPDPRNPDAIEWDYPPEEFMLCSYHSDTGTVFYNPDNPDDWYEVDYIAAERGKWE